MLNKILKNIIKLKPKNQKEFAKIKRKICGKFKKAPISNSDLFAIYKKLLKKKEISKKVWLENFLIKHPIRSLSGVAVVAVLTKSYPCPGKCIYCPTENGIPKSYLSNEPAVMRAVLCKFDPYKQVKMRIKSLQATGHSTDKIELIIMGGTWTYLPKQYQTWFIKRCFQALNNQNKEQTLKNLQKINETAKHRCVALTLETRPDFINLKEIKRMRELGCTKVELGIQSLDDAILQLNARGHKVKQIIHATELLKNFGFKICYHMMPNLLGSTITKDFKIFKELFDNPNFKPDLLKIYPCVVTKNSKLYNFWKQKKYKPYNQNQLTNLLIKIKQIIPRYVRIIRIIRDIPSSSVEAGNKISNLREMVKSEMQKKGLQCQCIRCRQAKIMECKTQKLKLFIEKYKASEGMEYFLSIEDFKRKTLYAFLRLRIPYKFTVNISALNKAGIIREIHTYGKALEVGKKNKKAIQHFGLGKKLILEAEKITKNLKIKKIAVISGIGVREYYRKIGYTLKNGYMLKFL